MSNKIQPRDLKFHIAENAKRHWCNNDMELSAMVDCFAVLLPAGERFFIRALKQYEGKIDDPALKQAMRAFYQQEAFHSREHADYNAGMAALGYDVDAMEAFVSARLAETVTPTGRLAATCALEHLTTTFSRTLLAKPELMDDAHEPYRKLWFWHALEELEHRSVALDVFAVVMQRLPRRKRYLLRTMALNIVLWKIMHCYIYNLKLYAAVDGVKPGLRFAMRCIFRAFVSPGFALRGLPYFLKYYLPWYDPEKADHKGLVARWRPIVNAAKSSSGA